jgi:sugar phosphate permease
MDPKLRGSSLNEEDIKQKLVS